MGMVLVGGEVVKKSVKVEEGQEVEARFIVSPELSVEGEDIPLDVSAGYCHSPRCTVHMRKPFSSRAQL